MSTAGHGTAECSGQSDPVDFYGLRRYAHAAALTRALYAAGCSPALVFVVGKSQRELAALCRRSGFTYYVRVVRWLPTAIIEWSKLPKLVSPYTRKAVRRKMLDYLSVPGKPDLRLLSRKAAREKQGVVAS
jgi:hypothetical protein